MIVVNGTDLRDRTDCLSEKHADETATAAAVGETEPRPVTAKRGVVGYRPVRPP